MDLQLTQRHDNTAGQAGTHRRQGNAPSAAAMKSDRIKNWPKQPIGSTPPGLASKVRAEWR